MPTAPPATRPSSPRIDVRLVDAPIAIESHDPVPQPGGGECVFLGRTRAETTPSGAALRALTYEAYRAMAERVLRDLAVGAASRHGCTAVRIVHRLGRVPVGEASVLVQVVCGHRAEAFAACRALIDDLKSTAPIWKREEWDDGGATWSAGTTAAPHRA